METGIKSEIDEKIAGKLPMWARNGLKSLYAEKAGRKRRYVAVMEPLYNNDTEDEVVFCAECIKDLNYEIQLYKKQGVRVGLDYMIFR